MKVKNDVVVYYLCYILVLWTLKNCSAVLSVIKNFNNNMNHSFAVNTSNSGRASIIHVIIAQP